MNADLAVAVMEPIEMPTPVLTESAGSEVAGLVAGVRRGEEGAVRELYACYHARLTRYALVVCRGDEASATEAVQNAFLKAIRSLRSVRDEEALWSWLARACRTSAMDNHRSTSRYAAFLGKFAALFSTTDTVPVEDAESVWHDALSTAMEALPDEDRALLDARYTHGLSIAAIAESSVTTERAIEGRLARLREKLRRSILQQLASQQHEI